MRFDAVLLHVLVETWPEPAVIKHSGWRMPTSFITL